MSKEPNLYTFETILNKTETQFKELLQGKLNEDLAINLLYFLKESNIKPLINLIKDSELKCDDSSKNILNNLLILEPLSLPIIKEFVDNDFFCKDDFSKRVDKTRQITSSILKSLQKQKIFIRGTLKGGKNTKDSEEQLEEVIDELNKHQFLLENIKEKKDKEKSLKEIKRKIAEIEKELDIKNINDLKNKLQEYESKKNDIDKIKAEIKNSKEIFTDLPNDEA